MFLLFKNDNKSRFVVHFNVSCYNIFIDTSNCLHMKEGERVLQMNKITLREPFLVRSQKLFFFFNSLITVIMIAGIKTQWYQRSRKQLQQLHDRFLSEEGKKIARSEVALQNARPHIRRRARSFFPASLALFFPIEIGRSLTPWRADSFADFLSRGNCRRNRRYCRCCCRCCRRRQQQHFRRMLLLLLLMMWSNIQCRPVSSVTYVRQHRNGKKWLFWGISFFNVLFQYNNTYEHTWSCSCF